MAYKVTAKKLHSCPTINIENYYFTRTIFLIPKLLFALFSSTLSSKGYFFANEKRGGGCIFTPQCIFEKNSRAHKWKTISTFRKSKTTQLVSKLNLLVRGIGPLLGVNGSQTQFFLICRRQPQSSVNGR